MAIAAFRRAVLCNLAVDRAQMPPVAVSDRAHINLALASVRTTAGLRSAVASDGFAGVHFRISDPDEVIQACVAKLFIDFVFECIEKIAEFLGEFCVCHVPSPLLALHLTQRHLLRFGVCAGDR